MSLVLKSWRADASQQDADGNFVTIMCRQQGLLSFILSILGIAPITTIKVGPERVEFTEASLQGYLRTLIPLQGVCSTYYGYTRPLVAALFIVFIGIAVGIGAATNISPVAGLVVMFLGLILGLLCYVLNKELTLGFVENSGHEKSIKVKPSMLDGVRIDESAARQVCQIVQNVIEAQTMGSR